MYSMQKATCQPATARQSPRPAMNIRQDENQLEIQFAVPGFRKDELTIRVEEQVLIVEGKPANAPEVNGFVRREFRAAAFEHRIRLHDRIDGEAILARVEDGILHVTLGLKQPLRRDIAVA